MVRKQYVWSRQSKLKSLKIPTHGCEPEQDRSISKIFRPLVVYVRREYVSVVERLEREDSPRPWANTMSERSDTWVQLVPDVRRVGAVGGVGVWFVLMFRMFLPQGHCVYYHSVTSKQLLMFWFVMKRLRPWFFTAVTNPRSTWSDNIFGCKAIKHNNGVEKWFIVYWSRAPLDRFVTLFWCSIPAAYAESSYIAN